jgi:D-alanyl-D-alanine carboxypeptidase
MRYVEIRHRTNARRFQYQSRLHNRLLGLREGNAVPFSPKAEALLAELGIPSRLVAARGLKEYQEAESLEVAELGDDGRHHLLIPSAVEAWKNLRRSASEAGVNLFVVSAFRSVERQVEIIKRKFEIGQSVSEVLAVSAPPCFSEHHTGRAVDVGISGCPLLDAGFEATPAFQWLRGHAKRYGFVMSFPKGNASGYDYEPWHWCYHETPKQGIEPTR